MKHVHKPRYKNNNLKVENRVQEVVSNQNVSINKTPNNKSKLVVSQSTPNEDSQPSSLKNLEKIKHSKLKRPSPLKGLIENPIHLDNSNSNKRLRNEHSSIHTH